MGDTLRALRGALDELPTVLDALARVEVLLSVGGATDSAEPLERVLSMAFDDASRALRTVYHALAELGLEDADAARTVHWCASELCARRHALRHVLGDLNRAPVRASRLTDAGAHARRTRAVVETCFAALSGVLEDVQSSESWPDAEASTASAPRRKRAAKAPASAPREKTPAAPAPLSDEAFDAEVLRVARSLRGTAAEFAGDSGRVFINRVWRAWTAQPAMTLADFKERVKRASQAMTVPLHRADMVELMNPVDVAESEIQRHGATFHFVGTDARGAAS